MAQKCHNMSRLTSLATTRGWNAAQQLGKNEHPGAYIDVGSPTLHVLSLMYSAKLFSIDVVWGEARQFFWISQCASRAYRYEIPCIAAGVIKLEHTDDLR